MASEILGLFTSPEQYNMMQQQAQQNRAFQFAQLDPFERATYGLYKGAGQLAGATAGLFGVEDPQLRMISQRQMLAKEIDPSDPTSILQAAQKAGQMGDQQFALTLSDYARKAQSEMALAQQRMREGKAAATPKELQIAQARSELLDRKAQIEQMPDSPDKARALSMIENTLASLPLPEGAKPAEKVAISNEIAALKTKLRAAPEGSVERQDLQDRIDFLSGAKENKANIKEIGVSANGDAVYLDVNKDQQYIYKIDKDGNQIRVPYTGKVNRTISTVSATANAGAKEQTAFQVGVAGAQVKRYELAQSKRDDAIASLTILNELARLNKEGVTSGAYAGGRVGAANLLNTLGLISSNDRKTLSNSQQFQKQSKDLIMKALGGKLGAGISNADVAFVDRIVPQLETSAEARQELINYMLRINKDIITEADALIDYAETNNLSLIHI